MGQDPANNPDDEQPDELKLAAPPEPQSAEKLDLATKPEYPTIGVVDDVAGANPDV